MNRYIVLCWLLPLVADSAANPADRAIIAAMKLEEVPNYSWTTVVTDDACSYIIEGKTSRGGLTWQRQPTPKVIARRLGRDSDADFEAFFSGPADYVIHTATGWKFLDDLPKRNREWLDDDEVQYVGVPVVVDPTSAVADPWGQAVVYLPVANRAEERPWSNYQFALARPQDDLAIIVSSHLQLDIDDDIVSGTLSNLGAQLLLVHDGHEYIRPLWATGTFKMWMSNDCVAKYNVQLAGVVVVGKKRLLVRQTASTEIRDIGTTAFDIPEQVCRKLLPAANDRRIVR